MTPTAHACEKCGSDLELITDTPVGPVFVCSGCGRNVPARVRGTTLKLPGLDRGRQEVLVHESEEPVMQRIIRALRGCGYEVLCTVHRHTRHRCSDCGKTEFHSGGYGADPGVPDLIVRGRAWPSGMWLGIETKGTRTPLSPAQKGLLQAGSIVVARSEREAIAYVIEAETALSVTERRHSGP